jgi:glycosyltransferase involved in cell wall biosynthesis
VRGVQPGRPPPAGRGWKHGYAGSDPQAVPPPPPTHTHTACSIDTSDNPPLLTVFMSVYNGEAYIRHAVESVLMQKTDYRYTIRITDDASTDATAAIISDYVKAYPEKITLEIRPENLGTKNRKQGALAFIKNCSSLKTKYFTFLDQDDYWVSEFKIQRALDFFEAHPGCTMFFSNYLIADKHGVHPAGQAQTADFDFTTAPFFSQTSSSFYRNVFSTEDIDRMTEFSDAHIFGDPFRNFLALSKGYGHYENSIGSVYNMTGAGVWSKLESYRQHFRNTRLFYYLMMYFDKPEHKPFLKGFCQSLFLQMLPDIDKLTDEEKEELTTIKKSLEVQHR